MYIRLEYGVPCWGLDKVLSFTIALKHLHARSLNLKAGFVLVNE